MYITLIDIFLYFKQYIYLNYFIIILILNIVINTITSNIKYKLLFADYLINSIQLNGAVLIKIFQWFNISVTNFLGNNKDTNNTYNLIFKKKIENLYENCKIHDINYTKNIFLKEYNLDFDETIELDKSYSIKSGSIAQVYKGYFKYDNKRPIAIKIVHPNIKYEMFVLKYFIKFFEKYFLNTLISYLLNIQNISKIVSFKNFIRTMENQTTMKFENNFLQYFYNEYKNNEYIIIPKSYFSSNNILIMEFIDGDNLENQDISEYNKHKLFIMHNLFFRDLLYNKQYIHGDLHKGNIKIQKYNEFYKLIIYDFGFCLNNDYRLFFKNMDKYVSINDYKLLGKLSYDRFITNYKITEVDYINDFINYFNNNKKYNLLNCGILFLNFIIDNNYTIEHSFIDLIMASVGGYKYALTNGQSDNINVIYNDISLLKQYNIFPELKEYYINLLRDDIFKSYINKFNLFDNKNNIIDASNNSILI